MSVAKQEELSENQLECLKEIDRRIDIHSVKKEENWASTPGEDIENEDVSDNEVSSQTSQDAKSFTAMDGELDFEDEGEGGEGRERDKGKNLDSDSDKKIKLQIDFPQSEDKTSDTSPQSADEDGQCSEKVIKDSENKKDGSIEEGEDDGEISDEDDLEEGEVKDNSPVPHAKLPLRQVCRYYNRGQCTYGNVCRFLHLSPNEKGNYNMFAPPSVYNPRYSSYGGPGNGISNIVGPSNVCNLGLMNQRSGPRGGPDFMPAPPPLPPPPAAEPSPVETAWERGLRQAKELVKKANKRKEEEPDFEEKRLNLSIDVNERNMIEFEKESEFNKPYKRQNDVHPYKYDEPNEVFIDNGEREAREHWRGGRYENFEIKYTRQDIHKERRDRERSPRGRRISSERDNRHSKHRSEERKRWRDDRLYEVQMRTPHRADEWVDPWRRSKTPKGGRRSRSRSGSYSSVSSYSYSDRSSRSSCSYSRSSSRSSCISSRSRSILPKRKLTPLPETIMSPKGPNRFPHVKNTTGIRSPKSSSRSRSVSKTPSISRSRSYSRSLSMDSVSSASSSVTHSSSASGSINRGASEPVITNRAAHLAALKRQEEITRAQKERDEREAEDDKVTSVLYDEIEQTGLEYENITEIKDIDLRENNVSQLPVSEQIAMGVTPFPSLQHLVPNPDRVVKEPVKGLHKQQIKLTLLNKPATSKLMNLPKKELDLSKIKPVDKDDSLKINAVIHAGVKRPLSPPAAAKPPTPLVPKKSASSRRDELLKQLKAVEDAIARKRAKFF